MVLPVSPNFGTLKQALFTLKLGTRLTKSHLFLPYHKSISQPCHSYCSGSKNSTVTREKYNLFLHPPPWLYPTFFLGDKKGRNFVRRVSESECEETNPSWKVKVRVWSPHPSSFFLDNSHAELVLVGERVFTTF